MSWPRYRTHPSKVTSPLHLGDTFKIKLNFQGTLKVDKFWHSYIPHSILSRRILRAFAQRTSLTSDTKTADATWALLSTLYKYYIMFFHKSQIFDSEIFFKKGHWYHLTASVEAVPPFPGSLASGDAVPASRSSPQSRREPWSDVSWFGADEWNRTINLLITSQLRCLIAPHQHIKGGFIRETPYSILNDPLADTSNYWMDTTYLRLSSQRSYGRSHWRNHLISSFDKAYWLQILTSIRANGACSLCAILPIKASMDYALRRYRQPCSAAASCLVFTDNEG